ncbi:MAG: putative TPR domain protein, component of TonB system [Nitrosopumilales archaeon]|nr:MAG: putative TPR domain protein, component of TonB system [Nitrosopumilales archaeon]
MVGLFSHPKRRLRKLFNEGEYKEALEFGSSIEEKYSNDPDFFFIMGSIYYILDDAKNALYYFDKTLSIGEFDTEALLLKANVHLYLKEHKAVKECCNKILEVDPQNKSANQILDNLE